MIYLLFILEHIFFVVRGFSFVPLAPVYPPGQMPDFQVLSPETKQCEFMALDFEPFEYDVKKRFQKLYLNIIIFILKSNQFQGFDEPVKPFRIRHRPFMSMNDDFEMQWRNGSDCIYNYDSDFEFNFIS